MATQDPKLAAGLGERAHGRDGAAAARVYRLPYRL
jgi:hypothetical protein